MSKSETTSRRGWFAKRLCLLAIVIVAFAGFEGMVGTPSALASTNYIKGSCGMHRGSIVVPYLHRYHVRIHYCAGKELIGGSNSAQSGAVANGLFNFWDPYNLGSWNWGGILDVSTSAGITVGACGAFAGSFVGEVPTGGFDTFITIGAGAGCVAGARQLYSATSSLMRTDK